VRSKPRLLNFQIIYRRNSLILTVVLRFMKPLKVTTINSVLEILIDVGTWQENLNKSNQLSKSEKLILKKNKMYSKKPWKLNKLTSKKILQILKELLTHSINTPTWQTMKLFQESSHQSMRVYLSTLNNPKSSTEEKVYSIWMSLIIPESMICKNNSNHIQTYGNPFMNGNLIKKIG
jgi:hypothetical protein